MRRARRVGHTFSFPLIFCLGEICARLEVSYAATGTASNRALSKVWPLACRRLEEFPDINSQQLFEELCLQFSDRFAEQQYSSLTRRVKRWRRDARARGVVIGPFRPRRLIDKDRGRRLDQFKEHRAEMLQCLEEGKSDSFGTPHRVPGAESRSIPHAKLERITASSAGLAPRPD